MNELISGWNVYIIKVLYMQGIPSFKGMHGVLYDDGNGYIIVFADSIDIASKVVVKRDALEDIFIVDTWYKGYQIDKLEI